MGRISVYLLQHKQIANSSNSISNLNLKVQLAWVLIKLIDLTSFEWISMNLKEGLRGLISISWLEFLQMNLNLILKESLRGLISIGWFEFLWMKCNLILKEGLRGLFSIKNNSFLVFRSGARTWGACCLLLEIWYLRAWVFRVFPRMKEFFSELSCAPSLPSPQ